LVKKESNAGTKNEPPKLKNKHSKIKKNVKTSKKAETGNWRGLWFAAARAAILLPRWPCIVCQDEYAAATEHG